MKRLFAALLSATVLASAAASAAAPTDSPLLGDWVLDVDSLPMPPQMRPRAARLAFRAEPDGRWTTRVDITDQAGKRLDAQSTLPLDGTPGKATGSYWVDVVAAKLPAPDVLVMQFVYEGIPRSTRVYTLSTDGKALTETETYFKSDGTPMMRTAVFHRAPVAAPAQAGLAAPGPLRHRIRPGQPGSKTGG